MKSLLAHLSVVAALGATLVSGAPAAAASPVPVRTSLHVGAIRNAAPRLPQRVITSTAGRQRPYAPSRLSPMVGAGLTPSVGQVPSRNRSLAPGVAPMTPPAPYPTPAPTPTPSADAYHIAGQQILINQDRASNGGLAPLAWSPCLANIAQQNAQRIAAQGYLSHTNGPTLDLGCDPGFIQAGENIAYLSSGIDDVAANTMFMNSAPHRANILTAGYRFVGTAWVVAPNGYGYIAVEFAG